jgi:hypothetical protein
MCYFLHTLLPDMVLWGIQGPNIGLLVNWRLCVKTKQIGSNEGFCRNHHQPLLSTFGLFRVWIVIINKWIPWCPQWLLSTFGLFKLWIVIISKWITQCTQQLLSTFVFFRVWIVIINKWIPWCPSSKWWGGGVYPLTYLTWIVKWRNLGWRDNGRIQIR